jgi:flagellar assembly factor FliW
MKLTTHLLGTEQIVDVSPEQIFAFDPPLGGFEELRRYALIPDGDDSPVEWLQSIEDENVALPLLEPFLFAPDYGFELPDHDAEALGMESPEDAVIRCILTLREAPEEITANLLAPIVLCRRTHLARQVVLQDSAYPLRHPVFSALGLAASA